MFFLEEIPFLKQDPTPNQKWVVECVTTHFIEKLGLKPRHESDSGGRLYMGGLSIDI